MNHAAHLSIGIASGFVAGTVFTLATQSSMLGVAGTSIAMTAGAVSGLLPDWDQRSNDIHDLPGDMYHYASNRVKSIVIVLLIIVAIIVLDIACSLGIGKFLIASFSPFTALGAVVFLAVLVAVILSKHRRFSHSILAMLLLSASLHPLLPLLAFSFGGGYLSHIIIDIFNKWGVWILWPIPFKPHTDTCNWNDKPVNRKIILIAMITVIILFTATVIANIPVWMSFFQSLMK